MLSPHEFATLMLVREAPDQIDLHRTELDALLERQLVMLEHGAAGRRHAYLTHKGRRFLDALHPGSTPGPVHAGIVGPPVSGMHPDA
ncbi:hypothetical protein LGN17_27015 [Burkholderia sp. AU30280]|uniref:hypothetical protein n=1 Tax=Burkholderia sp. AU30280 TaxID=2879628 RepID=UPI001CF3B18F|nr:hypothetical protein [Burkholderia sp. AU30280]MCA8276139.1 hypothetical protein [Burkholderia sp. AU30280]